jgi:hypothetical protein
MDNDMRDPGASFTHTDGDNSRISGSVPSISIGPGIVDAYVGLCAVLSDECVKYSSDLSYVLQKVYIISSKCDARKSSCEYIYLLLKFICACMAK